MSRQTCDYCHGVTFDDQRGHCVSCGAPRAFLGIDFGSVETHRGVRAHYLASTCAPVDFSLYTEIDSRLKGDFKKQIKDYFG